MDLALITDQNVQDIIDTASYGGITYWTFQPTAEEFAARPADKEYTIVEVGDGDLREVHHLSKDDVRKAYAALLDLDQKYVGSAIHGYVIDSYRMRNETDGIDCGYIDADAADCIVQVACFEEVRYG